MYWNQYSFVCFTTFLITNYSFPFASHIISNAYFSTNGRYICFMFITRHFMWCGDSSTASFYLQKKCVAIYALQFYLYDLPLLFCRSSAEVAPSCRALSIMCFCFSLFSVLLISIKISCHYLFLFFDII